jgi:rhodanese-related sulfurtransferase
VWHAGKITFFRLNVMQNQPQSRHNFTRTFFSAVAIGIISSAIGLLFNTVNPNGIPLEHKKIVKPAEEKSEVNCEPLPIYIEEAFLYFNSEDAIFIDSRQPEEFAAGHIKGAMNIPVDKAFPAYNRHKDKFPLDRKIVFYCDEGCDSAMELAFFFCHQGFTDGNILVYEDGFSSWRDSGYPVE